MRSDSETGVDLLGFRVHSDLIREVVMSPQLSPVTIGLFGDWRRPSSSSVVGTITRGKDNANDEGVADEIE